MEAQPRQTRILKFGTFEVDLEAGELRKSGMRLKLAGRSFQILQFLLEHPQEIVTREQLQTHIWPPGTFVDYDLALKKAINRIREVLGDSADNPRYIETVPRRGYRFIAPLSVNGDAAVRASLTADPGLDATRGSGRTLRVGIALGAGVAMVLVAMLALIPSESWRPSAKAVAPQIHSLAVLPLQNLSADPAQEYFSDGMTDALITDLAQIDSLRVISRTSSMQYKQTKKPLSEIARELNVDGIVEGTVQRSGERVRITAQLIYGPSDKHLWANSYERETRDIFAIERDITDEIARQIRARVTTPAQAAVVQPRPVNLGALEAYLQGNYYLNKGNGDEGMRKAEQYFQHAIDADPAYAPAYVGMAYSHYLLLRSTTDDRAMRRASAERAVALDPSYAAARRALGTMKYADWDWTGAEQEFRRAIALNPNDAQAHAELCQILDVTERHDESLSECQTAQQLDPDYDHLSLTMEARGQYDQAIELLQRSIEHHPQDAFLRYFLYREYGLKGMHKESIYQLEQSLTLIGLPEIALRVHSAYTAAGYRAALQEYARQLEQLHANGYVFMPRLVAEVYTQLGNYDRAFYWLEQGYQQRNRIGGYGGLDVITIEHDLDPLHSDPRWANLVRRVGLQSS